jgi:hypothetical protein
MKYYIIGLVALLAATTAANPAPTPPALLDKRTVSLLFLKAGTSLRHKATDMNSQLFSTFVRPLVLNQVVIKTVNISVVMAGNKLLLAGISFMAYVLRASCASASVVDLTGR